jgi:hypothetical protein
MKGELFTSVVLAAVTLGFSAMSVPRTSAAELITTTFTFTGAEQSWIVPDGVTTVHAVLVGGTGGAGYGPGGAGGTAARVEGDVPVTPGQALYVEVGGNGGTGAMPSGGTGGFNGGADGGDGGAYGGGGGGGGASDLRTVSRAALGSLDSRLIIAGGGGGGGSPQSTGGNGGDSAVWDGQHGAPALGGGAQGGAAGSDGSDWWPAGGFGGCEPGTDGDLGTGGAGGGCAEGAAGGGGGAGWWGGGGGGTSIGSGGGGAAGSSMLDGQYDPRFALGITVDDTGIPSITLTFTPEPGTGGGTPTSGTVSAEVIVPASAACLELDTTSVSFGTLPLGSELVRGTPEIQYRNCGGIDQTVLARGSGAAGAGAAWNLVDFTSCDDPAMGTDNYGLALQLSPDANLQLSETNQQLAFQPPGAINSNEALISTACPGSGGGGTTMSMSIIFLATE